jgi:pimeloyl-ACP methyl ester carboxylesterase
LFKLIGLALSVYTVICAVVYARQRAFIYHPTPPRPDTIGEAVLLPVDGAVLRLDVVRRAGRAAVIYFGGNAESVADSAADFARQKSDRTWVFVNYRGYGGSTGTPSEAALVADALAVWDWLQRDYADIAIVGRSLGTGVAVQLAAARPAAALVLVSPYDSLVSIGRDALPWLPVSWLQRDRFESERFASQVKCPVLVLVATHDRVVLPMHSRRLVAAFAPGQVSAIEVPGAEHNDIQLWPDYHATIVRFTQERDGR